MTPADLVLEFLDDLPDRVVTAVAEMAARKRKPPMTINDVLDALGRHADLMVVVERIRELLK